MATEGFKRKLTAVFSADVAGYSRLIGEDDEAAVRTLTGNHKIMSSIIGNYQGRVVDSVGDNLLAEFESVLQAVNCAVEVQRVLAERNTELPKDRKMEYRIGVNLGDVIMEGEKIYGDGVNIAARLESLAEPGGICISGFVYNQVKNRLKLEYEPMGEKSLKNIKEPVPVYRVLSFYENAVKSASEASLEKMAYPLPDTLTIAAPTADVLDKISKCAQSIEGVLDTHDLRVRTSGGCYQMEIHVVVDGQLTVAEGHNIAKAVENCLIEEVKEIGQIIIHVDPRDIIDRDQK